MMKSFFKKLAFVMALAMVVSMVAPAAQTAVAAEKKPLAIAYQKGAVITALNLTEVGATEDLRFVYAPENWKELNPTWTSSNPNVVSVDQNGVVKAEAAGTATVTVAVGTETAEVEVYSVDTKTFVATMGTADNREMTELTLTVGDDFDFAFYGIKDYSVDRYRCDWFAVDPEGVLDFDDTNGKLVAKKAGSAKISLGVMNLVTGLKTDVAPCVVTVVDETPVVDNSFTVKQKNSDTVEVTFANKDIANVNFKASSKNALFTNEDEFIQVGELKDGVVTVKFYNGLVAGTTYTLTNGDESVTFDANTGLVDKIVISYKCCNTANVAYAGQTVTLSAKVYSGDVELTTNNGVTFKHSSSLFGTESTGNTFYGVQAGEVVAVTATYYNTGSSTPVVATIAIPVVAAPEYRMKSTSNAMAIMGADTPYASWGADKISTSDLNKFMTFEGEDVYGGWVAGYAVAGRFYSNQHGIFRFTTTNDNVLGVSESNGALYPRSAGTAVIQVWFVNSATGTKTLVGSKQVTVYGPRVLTQYTLAGTASNNMASSGAAQYAMIASEAGADSYNKVTFKFTTKDQLSDKCTVALADMGFDYNDYNNDNGSLLFAKYTSNGEAKYEFTANYTFTDNTVAYKDVELTLKGKFGGVELKQNVVVRIFNVNYRYKTITCDAFVHSSSAWDLGVLGGQTSARVLTAGVVEFENNAYNNALTIQGRLDSIEATVNAANAAKARIANAQNVPTPEEAAAIASATALVENGGWYYTVLRDYWQDVDDAVVVNSNNTISYTVRPDASALSSNYATDLTVAGGAPVNVPNDVFEATQWGATVAFTFKQVVYNQYTSRYEYVTRSITKSLSNSDRATIGGTAEVMATSVPGQGVTSLTDYVQKFIHVTVYERANWTNRTLCNKCNWTTDWNGYFTLTGVKTNGQGVYNNIYVDSQTVNNWAYIVSIYVTYTNGGEVVTVEIPVNTRVEW